jgi:hypothetical protein
VIDDPVGGGDGGGGQQHDDELPSAGPIVAVVVEDDKKYRTAATATTTTTPTTTTATEQRHPKPGCLKHSLSTLTDPGFYAEHPVRFHRRLSLCCPRYSNLFCVSIHAVDHSAVIGEALDAKGQ